MRMVTFDGLYESLPADGWLTRDEALLLAQAAGPHKVGLEVGCYCGRSTVLLASMLDYLHCVDPFDRFCEGRDGDDVQRAWLSNMESRGFRVGIDGEEQDWSYSPTVYLYRQRVEDWIPERVDFAYLDGDHTYEGTLAQIRKAEGAKCVAIHDVNDGGGGLEVKRAALELLGPWSVRTGRLAVWLPK